MQVELIGSTGAGKSTLARRILQLSRASGIEAVMGRDFVLEVARLHWVRGYLARTLLIDLISLAAYLATWRSNSGFFKLAIQIIRRLPAQVGLFERLNIARNVFKNVGIYEVIRHYGEDRRLILVDEGTIHTAHYLFVHISTEPDGEKLSAFANLAPLPDAAVRVRQDPEVLIRRTLDRGHKRIPSGSLSDTARFVTRAVQTFDELIDNLVSREALVLVDVSPGGIVTLRNSGSAAPIDVARMVVAALEIPNDEAPRQESMVSQVEVAT